MYATLTHDRPRTFARQLRELAADLEAAGCRLTDRAREELGLEEPADVSDAAARTAPHRERTGNPAPTPIPAHF